MPSFDPSQPFEAVQEKPQFDPNQPHEVIGEKPSFDQGKPFESVTGQEQLQAPERPAPPPSSTPATDAAVSETAAAGSHPLLFKTMLENLPPGTGGESGQAKAELGVFGKAHPIVSAAADAAGDLVDMFIPKSPKQVLEMIPKPITQMTPDERNQLVLSGIQQGAILSKAMKSAPFSRDWFKGVFLAGASALGEFAGVKASFGRAALRTALVRADAAPISGGDINAEIQKPPPGGVPALEREPVVDATKGQAVEGVAPEKGASKEGQIGGGELSEQQKQAQSAPPFQGATRKTPTQEIGAGAVSSTGNVPPEPPHITSIKNAQVDAERELRGLPPAMTIGKRSFGGLWDEAMSQVESADRSGQPHPAEALIEELGKKPRALSDQEDALLLHRQVDLQNQFEKAANDLMVANTQGNPALIDELNLRSAQLSDKLLDVYNAGKAGGSETGRGLAARKMMAAEDYSLASMITKKRAALKGSPLTPEQLEEVNQAHQKITASQIAYDAYETGPKAEAYRKRLKTLAEQYRQRTAKGDFSPLRRPSITPDPDMLRLKAEVERAKTDFQRELIKDRLENRSFWERALDGISKWRRTFVLSWPTVLAKLTSASGELIGITPIEEAARTGITKVLPKSITSGAERYGRGMSVQAEAKAMAGTWKSLFKAVPDKFKTGNSDIDLLYGRPDLVPQELKDYISNIHGALKEPARQNEFLRTQQQLFEYYAERGADISDPLTQSKIGYESYKKANQQIFTEDNRVANAFQAAVGRLASKSTTTGRPSVAGKVAQTALRFEFPIVRIPLNIIKRTFEYSFGVPTGTARIVRGMLDGMEKMTPSEKDIIIRNLSRGSVGAAAMAYGYFNPRQFGGYYQRGERRSGNDIKPGHVRIGSVDLPPYLVHNPLLAQFQIGASIRRIADSKLKKTALKPQGYSAAVVSTYAGVTEDVPFVRQTEETLKALDPRQRNQFIGELLKSAVPGAVQWAATKFDVDASGNPVPRKSVEILDYPKSAIPGLRQQLPVKVNGRPRKREPVPK